MVDLAAERQIEFDAVGGLTMGADALAHGVAMVTGKAWFSVRKEPKSRGLEQFIEGFRLKDHPGTRVLLVEDVVSTGGSVRKAYDRSIEAGAVVTGIIPMVDRGEVGGARLRRPRRAILSARHLPAAWASSPSPNREDTMTPPVIQRWIDIVHSGRTDGIDALLADDVVFYSPAVFTPQEGRAITLAYLTAAVKVLGGNDFRYVGQWFADRSAVLEFVTDIDGIHVNGVDVIHWNDDDEIVEFKVMLRPLKALQTVMPAMAALLQTS